MPSDILAHRGHGESPNTGDAATYTFDQLVDDLAATIPGAVFELIPDAGHSPQLENRPEWVLAVQAHLTSAETA